LNAGAAAAAARGLAAGLSVRQRARLADEPGGIALVLDGGPEDGWTGSGTLAALDPRVALRASGADVAAALGAVDRIVAARRERGGTAATGLALLLGYEALDGAGRRLPAVPDLVALEVDRSLVGGPAGLRIETAGAAGAVEEPGPSPAPEPATPAHATGAVATTLPRDAYLRAVERVREHILDGDVYQANLCQRFEGRFAGSPSALWCALAGRAAAPRAAFVALDGMAVASLSPETFLTVRPPDAVATFPIKGTRRRGEDPERDRALRRELESSEKDAAELLMIVDLMRNDLGRVCRTGTIRVPELATTRTYANVHHRVARIEGRLRREVGPSELIRAVFPGGSITGAPKRRAREILAGLEPAPRGPFTGCLFWFGDDGSLDSSILIRTAVFAGGRFWLGAGGGVVVDSDPAAEWAESNDKIRPWAEALGFRPEDAR